MDKQFIINEIQQFASKNRGRTPGKVAFEKATGVKESDWSGKYWARWGDAVSEAGLKPNVMNPSYDKSFITAKFVSLIKELGKFPTHLELKIKARSEDSFPSGNAFANHLGKQSERASAVVEYCKEKGGLEDVIEICQPHIKEAKTAVEEKCEGGETLGFVYLLKSGKYYKIGFTNAPDRRRYEIGLQLPEEIHHIHSIKTDDPSGIEAYWHNRFRGKRMKGEWFNLSPSDVRVFRKRKFM